MAASQVWTSRPRSPTGLVDRPSRREYNERVRTCARCSSELSEDFRFCPHCGAAQRSKVVEYFRGHPDIDDGWLRISAYLTAPRHLRLSVWRSEQAEAAISLDPDEAHRLGLFLLSMTPRRDVLQIGPALRRGAQALRDVVARR